MINLRLLLLLANIGSAQKKEKKKKKKKKKEEEADRAELSLFRVSEGSLKERNKRHRRWIQY